MNEERPAPSDVKAALYARVSSERQAEKDLSIPAQLKAPVAAAKCVAQKALDAIASDASSLPALKPNQPTHNIAAPSAV